MHLQLDRALLRPWSRDDLASLVHYADNRQVWRQLRDRFPSPYTEDAARQFLAVVTADPRRPIWAIDVEGAAVGGIGLEPQEDVERVSAEIGYWLGEPFWNRGIVTSAVRAVTAYAFTTLDLWRIFAVPFADNAASLRVLEKAGYLIEGRLRQSAIKDGHIRDQMLYAAYRPRPPA